MGYKKYFQITTSDKASLERYAKQINTIVVNANIAVFNKKSIENKVSNYNLDLVIDPMTYMLQAKPEAIAKKNVSSSFSIKPSLKLVMEKIYKIIVDDESFFANGFIINYLKNSSNFALFLKNIYEFQTQYLNQEEFGAFAPSTNHLKIISAPYFDVTNREYLDLNKKILQNSNSDFHFHLFRIVVSKNTKKDLLIELIDFVNKSNFGYVEIWVDADMKKEFTMLTDIWIKLRANIKVLFKYISFDEIYEIREKFRNRNQIEGFITPFGYGESRKLYPIGGGIPVNKIYSLWTRSRVDFFDFFRDIRSKGFNPKTKNAKKYYLQNVCWCSICKTLLKEYDTDGILLYGDYDNYERKLKNGQTSKEIMATQQAMTLTTYHYIENKLREYDDFYSDAGFSGKWYQEYISKKQF